MFSKFSANFCIYVLTHRASQHLVFFVFVCFFSSIFFDELATVFSVSVRYVSSWSAAIQDQICFLWHIWKFSLADFANLLIARPTQTNTQDVCSYIASNWARQQYGREDCSQQSTHHLVYAKDLWSITSINTFMNEL